MKRAKLRKLSETIEGLMSAKKMSVKELAQKSDISYSTLIPIINGSRDCGILKLIAISEALDCNPDIILAGMFNSKHVTTISNANVKYMAILISVIPVTYCMLYNINTQEKTTSVFQFPLKCSQNTDEFIDHITTSLQKLARHSAEKVEMKNIAVFTAVQQYGRENNRNKIQKQGEHCFYNFFMESDAITNHKALLGNKNGICITINDGDAITYSIDKGKNIVKLHSHGFPISDIAGNFWIGCEALKHVINVKENTENNSILSDKILATFDDDIDFLSEYTVENPWQSYTKASSIVKELVHRHQKARGIVAKSADLLMQRIKVIDKETKTQLPICVSGDLAYIYEEFFPKNRLIKFKNSQNDILLNYGIELLNSAIKNA